MKDGRTRKAPVRTPRTRFHDFLSRNQASLVVVSGGQQGMEYTLESERVSLGRGPGVDFAFDDPAMSREHAAVEFVVSGFRVRDLGSTNGLLVNGSPASVGDLKHGDRFEIGSQVFQLVVEPRAAAPPTHDLSDVG